MRSRLAAIFAATAILAAGFAATPAHAAPTQPTEASLVMPTTDTAPKPHYIRCYDYQLRRNIGGQSITDSHTWLSEGGVPLLVWHHRHPVVFHHLFKYTRCYRSAHKGTYTYRVTFSMDNYLSKDPQAFSCQNFKSLDVWFWFQNGKGYDQKKHWSKKIVLPCYSGSWGDVGYGDQHGKYPKLPKKLLLRGRSGKDFARAASYGVVFQTHMGGLWYPKTRWTMTGQFIPGGV